MGVARNSHAARVDVMYASSRARAMVSLIIVGLSLVLAVV